MIHRLSGLQLGNPMQTLGKRGLRSGFGKYNEFVTRRKKCCKLTTNLQFVCYSYHNKGKEDKMNTTTNLVAGRIKFQNALKRAGLNISLARTKRLNTGVNQESNVISMRDVDFNGMNILHELHQGKAPAYFALRGITQTLKTRLLEAGFQFREATELNSAGVTQTLQFWFLAK